MLLSRSIVGEKWLPSTSSSLFPGPEKGPRELRRSEFAVGEEELARSCREDDEPSPLVSESTRWLNALLWNDIA